MADFVDELLGVRVHSCQLDESFSMQEEEFKEKLSSCVTAEERVNFIYKLFRWTPLASQLVNSKFSPFSIPCLVILIMKMFI